MLTKKQKIIIKSLSIIELLLAVVGVFVLTVVFKLVDDNMRYFFLLGDIFIIINFSNTIGDIEKNIPIIKNTNSKINTKYQEKLSI